jgi:hypothetical protein
MRVSGCAWRILLAGSGIKGIVIWPLQWSVSLNRKIDALSNADSLVRSDRGPSYLLCETQCG